jgi:long-subunit fatty acid transport protein
MNPSENRQSFLIALFVVISGILATTAQAEPRHSCSATHVAKASKAPAPEPKKVEKTNRPITAELPAHREFQLAAVETPTNVKVNGKINEHFVISTEAGTETTTEDGYTVVVEAHLIPGPHLRR